MQSPDFLKKDFVRNHVGITEDLFALSTSN